MLAAYFPLSQKQTMHFNFQTDLNTGTGAACAGQIMAAWSFSFLVIV
jgi:hypothetical protein